MKQNSLIIILLIICGISIYLNFANKTNLKASNELNDLLRVQLDSMYKSQKKQLTSDSLKYVNAIDSLSHKIEVIKYKRKNDILDYQSQIAKINTIVTDSAYLVALDSIKQVCCSNRTNR